MEGLSSESEDDDKSKHKKQRRVPLADDLDDYLTDKDDEEEDDYADLDLNNDNEIQLLEDSDEDNNFSSRKLQTKIFTDSQFPKKSEEKNKNNKSELAYTFSCPSTME